MKKIQLPADKTALILIEFQNEWVSKEGSLRKNLVIDEAQFEHAISCSKKVLKYSRQKHFTIIHVTLNPDDDYQMFGKAAFGMRHVIPLKRTWQGEQGAIYPDFLPEQHEHLISERIGASAFSGSNLDLFLRNNKIENLLLIGFATHVCVESTLRSAHDLGYTTFVITEATGAFTEAQKQHFSQHIIHHFGKEIDFCDLI